MQRYTAEALRVWIYKVLCPTMFTTTYLTNYMQQRPSEADSSSASQEILRTL
jgi:hypothetical protein